MELSLSNLLFDRAEREGERPAILTAERLFTYAELATDAADIARLLLRSGLGGQRISLLLPNLPYFPALFHGVIAAGGTVVMSNPVNSPREIEEQLHDAASAAVLTTVALARLLPPGTRTLLVDELPGGLRELRAGEEEGAWLPLERGDARELPLRGGDSIAAILFTAADSGRARGAPLSHRNLVANLSSTREMLRLHEEDRIVAALPQVHAFGLTVSLNGALAAGAAIVPVERFHPVRTLELISATQATVLAGVPAMFMGLISVAEKNGVPPHALRITLSGGAPIDPHVQQAWEHLFGIPLRQGYGLTEASPVCLFNDPGRPNRPGTIGLPIPRVEVTIRDGDGRELPEGEVGEICVRGENVFGGYLDEAPGTSASLRDGWLRTGDLGSRDGQGYFRFRGLLKQMFTRSGFNVYPRELERVIASDARIARALVMAQPDPAKENEIILIVQPEPGADLGEEEVKEICKARLAAYKQPGRIIIDVAGRGGDALA